MKLNAFPSVGMLIKRVIDLESSTRLFVTGSSSLDLAGGVYESATGRVRPLTLWPLSAEEIALHSSWFDVVRSLPERMILGNYPSVVLNPKEAKRKFKDLYRRSTFQRYFRLCREFASIHPLCAWYRCSLTGLALFLPLTL